MFSNCQVFRFSSFQGFQVPSPSLTFRHFFTIGGEDKRAKSSDHVWHQMECSLGQNKQLLLNTFVYIFEKSIDRL